MTRSSRIACVLVLVLAPIACGHRGGSNVIEDIGHVGRVVEERDTVEFELETGPLYEVASPSIQAAWRAYARGQAAAWRAASSAGGSPSTDGFEIELAARAAMLDFWRDAGHAGEDRYIDLLAEIDRLGFLDEYVIAYFAHPGWTVDGPHLGGIDVESYATWAARHLAGHSPKTLASVAVSGVPSRIVVPGASLPDPESFVDGPVPRCDLYAELRRALEAWKLEEQALPGRALVARDGFMLLSLLHQPAIAEQYRETGVTMVPLDIARYGFLAGYCAIEERDWDVAIEGLEAAAAIAPFDSGLRLELAQALTHERRFQSALEQVAFVIENSNDPCMIAMALRKRGFIEIEQGKLVEARATYTSSLDYEPGSALARSELAVIDRDLWAQGYLEAPRPEYVPPPAVTLKSLCTNPRPG